MRLAILGGGAVTRLFYLPLFRDGVPGLELALVADPSKRALDRLGPPPPGVAFVDRGFADVFEDPVAIEGIDGVVVALPHRLHVPAVTGALAKSLHVFCEKPLGLGSEEVETMVGAAAEAGRVLAVCQPRRGLAAAAAIRRVLSAGGIGRIERVEWREGRPYAWPAESLAQIRREEGGVELFDVGAHVFDLLGWWLGPLDVTDYGDDGKGGTPAEHRIGLRSGEGATISVELSRARWLANRVEVSGTAGRIGWDLTEPGRFVLEAPALLGIDRAEVDVEAEGALTLPEAIGEQLRAFGAAVRGTGAPAVVGSDALVQARVFDACRPAMEAASPDPVGVRDGRHVVVTGAGGFIGCRLVEALLRRGDRVTALVHRPGGAVRLARNPVRIEICDVTDPGSLGLHLTDGCAVVHCAVSHRSPEDLRGTILDGTRHVLEAAEAAGARRAVLFSSMLAYGDPPPEGVVTEGSRWQGSDMEYARAKSRMERESLAFAAESDLEVVVLQPTCVFGPWGSDFVTAHLDAMAEGRFFLVDGGRAPGNLVHVDNVVGATLRALDEPGIGGRTYLVNEDGEEMPWREYFELLATAAFGREAVPLPSLSVAELEGIEKEWKAKRGFPRVFREAVRKHPPAGEWLAGWRPFRLWQRVRPGGGAAPAVARERSGGAPAGSNGFDPTPPELERRLVEGTRFAFGRSWVRFFVTRARYSSERIRRELGWAPEVPRPAAMAELEAWVRRTRCDAEA